MANNFGTEDPYFEQVPATRIGGRPSTKTKKRRKALPAGISEHDGKVLTKVKRRAYHLDMSLFNCCGVRFGWSSVIGIIPGFGDVIDAFMAVMVMRTCQQVEGGLPADVQSKMYFNIALDFGIGLVPFLGDIADALFRANTRNAVVLEKYLRDKGAMNLKAQGHSLPAIDPSDPEEYDKHMNAQYGAPPQYTQGEHSGHVARQSPSQPPSQPPRPQVEAPVANSQKSGGGWFSGFGSKKTKQADVESGIVPSQRQNEALPPLPQETARTKSLLQKNRP